MQIKPRNRFRRSQHNRQLQLCVPLVFTDGAFYRELRANYYTVRKPAKAKARAVSQLEALGYTVTLTPLAETA
jgi:hypothetical protein